MKSLKTIFIITILSILVFGFCTLLSYLLSKEASDNFELGWPYKFYYQFKIRDETANEIQHGSWPMNLIYNSILSFVFAILIFLVYKKLKRNNLITSA
jgi:hypothetical protein